MLPTDNFNPPDPNMAAMQQNNMQTPGSPAASQMQPSPQMQPQATPELTTLQPASTQNSSKFNGGIFEPVLWKTSKVILVSMVAIFAATSEVLKSVSKVCGHF